MNMFQGRRRCYTKELPHGSQSSVELIKVTSQQLRGDKKKHIGAWEEKKKSSRVVPQVRNASWLFSA